MKNKITFTKMQALGNDFIVIEDLENQFSLTQSQIQKLAHRKFGVGFDQLLLIQAKTKQSDHFFLKIFNADGSESFQCGNGLRSVAKYLWNQKICHNNLLTITTETESYQASLESSGQISINMKQPILEVAKIPFIPQGEKISAYSWQIEINSGQSFEILPLSFGNPHGVIFCQQLDQIDLIKFGSQLENHPCFPAKANIEFVEIISENELNILIFERGVGPTMACGSGACAAMAAARLHNKIGHIAKINMPGGSLTIDWQGLGNDLKMIGNAEIVYSGSLEI